MAFEPLVHEPLPVKAEKMTEDELTSLRGINPSKHQSDLVTRQSSTVGFWIALAVFSLIASVVLSIGSQKTFRHHTAWINLSVILVVVACCGLFFSLSRSPRSGAKRGPRE